MHRVASGRRRQSIGAAPRLRAPFAMGSVFGADRERAAPPSIQHRCHGGGHTLRDAFAVTQEEARRQVMGNRVVEAVARA